MSAEFTPRDVNSRLLQSLIAAFAQNPEADLTACLPSDYSSHFPPCSPPVKKKRESKLAQLNRRTIDALLQQFVKEPAGWILQGTEFPSMYELHRNEPEDKAKKKDVDIKKPRELPPDHFASMLDEVPATASFDIAAPLSPEVNDMLRQQTQQDSQGAVSALKAMIKNSRFLWSGTVGGGFVAKLSDNVAVRVSWDDQSNHYAAYEFLAEHAPNIPVPRPHGLIHLDDLSVMFFSYVPGVTLEKVWPTLSQQQKINVRNQLNDILEQVRKIQRNDRPIGMVNGQGVVDLRDFMREHRPEKPIKTVAEFEQFIFSYRPWVGETYVHFLQSLLPEFRFDEACLFTHGDLRPANIMVEKSEDGDWTVTGIVDWEEAGFYPAYWESVTATRAFSPDDENDWYLMLPAIISPKQYPVQWLTDRLWDSLIEQLAKLDKHVKKSKATPWQP